MSIALFGLSGDVRTSAAPDTSLSIREQALRNLEQWLISIKSYSPSVAEADRDNTVALEFEAGGSYTGTVTRLYRIEVVTGGVSGVAEVTVTDATSAAQTALWPYQDTANSNTADDGPVAEAVTSGVAIDLGSLGATFTMTWSGSLTAGDVWFVWAGPYQNSVRHVTREMDSNKPPISIEIQVPLDTPDESPITKEQNEAAVVLQCFVPPHQDQASLIESLLADVKKSMRLDHTRGGTAIDTRFEGSVAFALSQLKERGGFDLQVVLTYRHDEDDPRSP